MLAPARPGRRACAGQGVEAGLALRHSRVLSCLVSCVCVCVCAWASSFLAADQPSRLACPSAAATVACSPRGTCRIDTRRQAPACARARAHTHTHTHNTHTHQLCKKEVSVKRLVEVVGRVWDAAEAGEAPPAHAVKYTGETVNYTEK